MKHYVEHFWKESPVRGTAVTLGFLLHENLLKCFTFMAFYQMPLSRDACTSTCISYIQLGS